MMRIALPFQPILFFIALLAYAGPSHTRPTLQAPDVPSTLPINASWNNDNVVPVIWIYNKPSTCPYASEDRGTFLTITPNRKLADREWSYTTPVEHSICMELESNGEAAFCEDGEIKIQFFEPEKEYRGTYTLKMRDGSRRDGKFRAKYCPTNR
jgi:hypothetical protein